MTIGILFFGILFLLGMIVTVFYLEYATVAIMGLLILIPIFMLLFLIIMRTKVSVTVECKNPLAEMDDIDKPAKPNLTLIIENRSRLLPITKGIATIKYSNHFSGDSGKVKIRFSVDASKKRDRRLTISMPNCGNVAMKVVKVRIYDYMSIFAWTIGKNFETQNVLVLPPQKEIYLGDNRWYNETTEDSDRFSLYKKGDDPSEIFDIREYMDGDKIQRIHWKLSSKVGSLMVKEGSLPLSKAVNIFVDLCATEDVNTNMNKLAQGIYSISMYLSGNKVPQKYIWNDKENGVCQEYLVEQEEELFWMFEELFKCRPTDVPEELAEAYLAWDGGRPLEAALYLTVTDHNDLENMGITRNRLEIMDLRGDEFENQE